MREMKSWTKDDSMTEKTDVDQSDENQTSHFSAILSVYQERSEKFDFNQTGC